MVLLNVVRNAAKRVPSIRFRAGQPQAAAGNHGSHSAGNAQVSPNTPQRQGNSIESYQLPPRYKRLPLDDAEIEMINSGFYHK